MHDLGQWLGIRCFLLGNGDLTGLLVLEGTNLAGGKRQSKKKKG